MFLECALIVSHVVPKNTSLLLLTAANKLEVETLSGGKSGRDIHKNGSCLLYHLSHHSNPTQCTSSVHAHLVGQPIERKRALFPKRNAPLVPGRAVQCFPASFTVYLFVYRVDSATLLVWFCRNVKKTGLHLQPPWIHPAGCSWFWELGLRCGVQRHL